MSGIEREVRRKPEAAPVGAPTVVLEAPVTRRAPALQVGAVHDPAEHDADRLAERVVARLRAQEAADAGHEHAADEHHDPVGTHRHAAAPVRRAAAPTVGREGGSAGPELSAQIEAMRGGGSALDADVRRRMGSAFGTDLSRVRVHTDEHAAQAASAMGALAFTTGDDIFFGAGQYRPDEAAGQHVLAHELAHTVQQRGGARRKVSRLWDFSQGLDLTQAAKIRTLTDQPVLFLDDDRNDTLVVKLENQPVGLQILAGKVHQQLSRTNTIEYRKLSTRDRATLNAMIRVTGLLDAASWASRGLAAKPSTDPNDRDAQVAAGVDEWSDYLVNDTTRVLEAMSFAKGDEAKGRAKAQVGAVSDLRKMLADDRHSVDLGRMTAVDLFLGNDDRVFAGNLGNWFYDPNGSMTVLDNVAPGQAQGFDRGLGQYTQLLEKSRIVATATSAVDTLLSAVGKKDPGTKTWAAQQAPTGGTWREHLIEQFAEGLREGRKHIVKVFTSTRFTIGGSGSRAIKKSLKADARAATGMDAGGASTQYYETLKNRAAWLAKH